MSDVQRAEVVDFAAYRMPTLATLATPIVEPIERYAGAFLMEYENVGTQRAYRANLRDWLAFCAELSIEPFGARRTHFVLWMRECAAKGNVEATVNRKMTAVTSFYQWLADEEVIDKNRAKTVPRPKVPDESTRDWMNGLELARCIEVSEFEGGYAYALVCILAYNALRVGEVIRADVSDLGVERHHHTLRIMGKGKKPATIVLNGRTHWALVAALDGRGYGPLILTRGGGRLTRDSAGRTCRRIARAAAIKGKNITPHSFRHSSITAAHDAGADPREVQAFARHSKADTTARYDHKIATLDQSLSYRLAGYVSERTY